MRIWKRAHKRIPSHFKKRNQKNMGYHIDLKSISIDKYKEVLKSTNLIPSRMILKENTSNNLDIIKSHNIQNLEVLQKTLRDKNKLQELSKKFGISVRFLEVLRVEINGYLRKPNRIKDFSCIDEGIVLGLEKLGLKNTMKLYEEVLTKEKRNELSNKTGISKKDIMQLTKLTDLSRIRWVNHTFAYVLLEAGYDTVEKVANADYMQMYEVIKKLNEERKIYNAHIGANDMKLCIQSAKS